LERTLETINSCFFAPLETTISELNELRCYRICSSQNANFNGIHLITSHASYTSYQGKNQGVFTSFWEAGGETEGQTAMKICGNRHHFH